MRSDWIVGALIVGLAVSGCEPPPSGAGSVNADDVDLASEGLAYRIDPDRVRACQTLTGGVDERVDACLAEAKANPSNALIAEVRQLQERGKVLLIGGSMGEAGVETIGLGDVPGLRAALLARDEAAAAKVLRDQGVGVVVVHRDLSGAIDRDSVVLSRLVQHDFLEWFRLWYVSGEQLVYTVRGSDTSLPDVVGAQLLDGLRARLSHTQPARQTWMPERIQMIGSMRLQGETLLFRTSQGQDLEKILDDLADGMERRWDREVEPRGIGSLQERLPDVRLEIHVVMERARVEPRSDWQLFDLWELGVDGVMFQHREGVSDRKFTYVPGSEAVAHSHRSADEFLRYAVDTFGWRDRRPWRDPSTELDLIRTEHFMEEVRGGNGRAVRLYRGMPIETMENLTDTNVRQMLIDGAWWWVRNQRADGSYNYKYWPDQNRMSDDYNEVRHALGPRDLVDAWRYDPQDAFLASARAGMDWLLRYAVYDKDKADDRLPHPMPGSMLFRYDNNQKLGTVSVSLLGWVAWAKATGNHSEDDRIRRMAKFNLDMQLDNGKFEPYYVPKGHPYYGQRNDIVPGEAALALGLVAEYFDEPKWMEFFPKFLDFYEPWFRERAARKRPTGRWPHDTYTNNDRLDLVQFGPWSVMASKQYYRLTGDERAAAFGLEVSDWMIDNYQWTGERAPFPDYVGGYYKMPSELPAMQTFCYSEGTAAAYEIAARFRPDQKPKHELATREAIRFLRVMQYDTTDTYFFAKPDLVHGGIKYAMNENKIRIDYVGHGLSTVTQYLDGRKRDPSVGTLDLGPLLPPIVGARTTAAPRTEHDAGGGDGAE